MSISTVSSVHSVYCLAGAALIFIQTQGDAAMYYAPRVTAATVWQPVHIVILPRVAVAVHAVDLLLEGARPPAQEPVRGARGGEARARHDERALQLGVQPRGRGVWARARHLSCSSQPEHGSTLHTVSPQERRTWSESPHTSLSSHKSPLVRD